MGDREFENLEFSDFGKWYFAVQCLRHCKNHGLTPIQIVNDSDLLSFITIVEMYLVGKANFDEIMAWNNLIEKKIESAEMGCYPNGPNSTYTSFRLWMAISNIVRLNFKYVPQGIAYAFGWGNNPDSYTGYFHDMELNAYSQQKELLEEIVWEPDWNLPQSMIAGLVTSPSLEGFKVAADYLEDNGQDELAGKFRAKKFPVAPWEMFWQHYNPEVQ